VQPKLSVVIPTYNRRAILEKALLALASQTLSPEEYEVVLVDDGSTDGTRAMVDSLDLPFSLTYRYQERKGPAAARNAGIRLAKAPIVVFIDSDIVVKPGFLEAHLSVHGEGDVIGHGAVIHTDNLEDPTSAEFKITDISRAFFATGNASIAKVHLERAGMFDESFVEYGWEDLELGIRLRKLGLRAVKVPGAEGYHYKKRLTADDVPSWCRRERERGHTAVIFYRKVPTIQVRMMTMITPVAFWLDRALTIGGWTEHPKLPGLLRSLEAKGRHSLLRFVVRIVTLHAYFEGLREGLRASR